jgi:hypothetical protein
LAEGCHLYIALTDGRRGTDVLENQRSDLARATLPVSELHSFGQPKDVSWYFGTQSGVCLIKRVSVFALTPVLVGVFDGVVQLPQLVNGAVVRDAGELYAFPVSKKLLQLTYVGCRSWRALPKFVGQHTASVYLHNSVQRYDGELIGKA